MFLKVKQLSASVNVAGMIPAFRFKPFNPRVYFILTSKSAERRIKEGLRTFYAADTVNSGISTLVLQDIGSTKNWCRLLKLSRWKHLIISVSRRTDVLAFYGQWFMNRIRAGFCTVPNPFNRKQISRISLLPNDVDIFVFWTRNPRPLFPYLNQLDGMGYKYYFQYTIMNNPREIDSKVPSLAYSLETFKELSDRIGPEKIIWRYDPIVLSQITDPSFHIVTFSSIIKELKGFLSEAVISIVDVYEKARKRLILIENDIKIYDKAQIQNSLAGLIPALVAMASEHGIQIKSCAEELDLGVYGVSPGKCIDDQYIKDGESGDVRK